MKKRFKASGYNYVFEIVRGNEAVFYVEKNEFDELGFRLNRTRTINQISNPIAVFRKVRELLLTFVLDNKINYFCFRGKSDRFKIYTRFANSLRRYGYDYTVYEGLFSFYREEV